MAVLRPVPPDPEMIAWLQGEEGQVWSLKTFARIKHSSGFFATIKDDHECGPNDLMCYISSSSPYPDELIRSDIRHYGISGVPWEWKQEQQRLNEASQEPT